MVKQDDTWEKAGGLTLGSAWFHVDYTAPGGPTTCRGPFTRAYFEGQPYLIEYIRDPAWSHNPVRTQSIACTGGTTQTINECITKGHLENIR